MGKTDRGKEFLQVLELSQNGKAVKGEPKSGQNYEIRMRKGQTFHGDADKALKVLEASFEGAKFAWAKDSQR